MNLVLRATATVTAFLPTLVGSTWTAVFSLLSGLGAGAVCAIAALWFAGLGWYTLAVRASLPGLSVRQALALNLAGSSAANLLPFGGVVGTGMNLAMIRSWRLPFRSFASSVAVLNLLNILGKLVLPVAAAGVVAYDLGAGSVVGRLALWLGAAMSLVCVAVVAAVASASWARVLDRVWARVRRRTVSGADNGPIQRLHRDVRITLRRSWGRLAAGMSGYLILQFLLFALCLHLTGVDASLGIGAVFAAFAAERAVTLAVVTPAGAGLAEISAAGLLVLLGGSPLAAAAGVVLYRLFVFGAEIPVGAAVFAGWALRKRPAAA